MSDGTRYPQTTAGVDWRDLKRDLAATRDNGRTPAPRERSFANCGIALAWDGDALVGKVSARADGVCNAGVDDDWTPGARRQRGIGTELMPRVVDGQHRQHLHRLTDGAVRFHDTLGYQRHATGMFRVIGSWLQGGMAGR